ncbi:hypothetical protein BLI708_06705 [Bifidobacterium imperatoris]|uniref:Uncharacterized protein n=1 Tax=Bifidobacterium imperatoris TaxID=2020965 RepID=A0ABX7S164_9BIFI|nr:hypothetical protein [Bifidobacterium imperatoris]QSY56961.1 hypothetical protein BLI708_06705 [Bifidobacterium imperatoris]
MGWYANDNLYSCSITDWTTDGCVLNIKNVGEVANQIDGFVYAIAWGEFA